MVQGIQNVNFLGEISSADGQKKVIVLGPTNRKEDLPADTLDLSTKKNNKEEKKNNLLNSTCESITKGVKSFVTMTVDAFAKAGSEAVVDKVVKGVTK